VTTGFRNKPLNYFKNLSKGELNGNNRNKHGKSEISAK